MNSANFKTIWILSLLLFVIIILSGIRVCNTPRITSDPYVDVKYRSRENFAMNAVEAAGNKPNDYQSLYNLIKLHRDDKITQSLSQQRQDKDLHYTEKLLNEMTAKFKHLKDIQN